MKTALLGVVAMAGTAVAACSGPQTSNAASASGATTAPDAGAVNGKLAPEVIQRIVRAGFPSFKQCFDAALEKDPSARGRTSTRFIIDTTGHVKVSSDLGSTGKLPPEMGPCVASHFEGLVFPPPEGGNVTVVYPLVFGNAGDSEAQGSGFDKVESATAMSEAANKVQSCAKPSGPKGAGHIKVTFDPSGHVIGTELDTGPFAGTAVGACIAARFHQVHVSPFSGNPVTVGKSFVVP
jgi:hypothetical protein